MKSEKPRRKGPSAGEFQQVPSKICYTAGKRTDHQRIKARAREEDAVGSKVEDSLGL